MGWFDGADMAPKSSWSNGGCGTYACIAFVAVAAAVYGLLHAHRT